MAYLVRLTDRALRDLESIHAEINAGSSEQARAWFDGLTKAVFSLESLPNRGAVTGESSTHRQILYGRKRHTYRIIYHVDERSHAVTVVHIRHGARLMED